MLILALSKVHIESENKRICGWYKKILHDCIFWASYESPFKNIISETFT